MCAHAQKRLTCSVLFDQRTNLGLVRFYAQETGRQLGANFADMAAREKSWATFREDPEWVKLRTTPGYGNAEILTSITNLFLRPTDYSQI